MTTRLLGFEAIENFRDYGDYATAAGRRVRPGLLLRSGHHARATDADLERLKVTNLGAVVDLRRGSERKEMPSRRYDGFDARVIEVAIDDGIEAPHIAFLKSAELTVESGRGFMDRIYRGLAFDPAHVAAFTAYFEALAELDRPVLIHCAAGKDRTGFLAALTHHLLGVSRDDMIEDYLLTNAAVDLDGRAPEIAARIAKAFNRDVPVEAVVPVLGVEESYLAAAFSEIEVQAGSLDAYLEQALGVDAARKARIVERLSA